MTDPVKLGFLYPGHSAEDDLPRLANLLSPGVEAIIVHTTVAEDAHTADALLDVGRSDRLLAGAKTLKGLGGVEAACWACTSGSFVFGLEGARKQAEELQDYLGAPVTSTSLAFVDALVATKLNKVAIAATYPKDLARQFADFLREGGTEVVAVRGAEIMSAAEVGTLNERDTIDFVAIGDHPDAEAVLVPDTALHTVTVLEQLEARIGKPVITANQVSMWQTLRIAGELKAQPKLGALFTVT